MRIIDDETVRSVINTAQCIPAMQSAFEELARKVAATHPRQRYKVGGGISEYGYMANMIAGAVPSAGVAALRYNSWITAERVVHGGRRMVTQPGGGRAWGFVLLFSLSTGEPLACIQDFSFGAMRVGATTAVAVRALAKKGSRVLALYGTGAEATSNLEGICAVLPIQQVNVFSPDRAHREVFADRMAGALKVAVNAKGSAEAVLEGADIILCATNSSQPVFDGRMLSAGQLVCTLANSDHVQRRTEVDETTFLKAGLIVVNHYESLVNNQQRELVDLIEDGRVPRLNVVELGDVLIGNVRGRSDDNEIICYKSNSGLGIQFAAGGKLIYDACERDSLGKVIPTEWFGTDVRGWQSWRSK